MVVTKGYTGISSCFTPSNVTRTLESPYQLQFCLFLVLPRSGRFLCCGHLKPHSSNLVDHPLRHGHRPGTSHPLHHCRKYQFFQIRKREPFGLSGHFPRDTIRDTQLRLEGAVPRSNVALTLERCRQSKIVLAIEPARPIKNRRVELLWMVGCRQNHHSSVGAESIQLIQKE